jgi:PKD repeat protein
LWTDGSTTASVELGVGTHSVTAIDSNTDTATATFTVAELPLPVADFTYTITGGTVDVTSTSTGSPTTTNWDFDGMPHTGATASHTFDANGDYDITLIVTNSCGSDTLIETVTITGVVGINNLGSTLVNVQLMPNPSNGTFTLNLVAKETSPVSVRIFNLQGQQVYTNTINLVAGQASNQAISLSNAVTGIYIIQIQANDALVTEKLIVK